MLTLTDSEVQAVMAALIGAGRSTREAQAIAAKLAPRPVPTAGPKLPALGSKGHDRCKFHEPATFAKLATRVVCFDEPRPTKAAITAKLRFAQAMDAALAKRAAAWAARLPGDGRIAMDGGKRLTPRQYAKWRLAQEADRKTQATPFNRYITVAAKSRPVRERDGQLRSKLVSSRPRRRKAVIRLTIRADKAA